MKASSHPIVFLGWCLTVLAVPLITVQYTAPFTSTLAMVLVSFMIMLFILSTTVLLFLIVVVLEI